MDDLELTTALASLGLDRDNHRAVILLPLVEVAWADGRVQRAERKRIASIARKYGIEVQEGWLDRWLSRRPSVKTFLAARTVLLALMARGGREPNNGAVPSAPRIETLEGLLDLCQRVAEAAGGLFGLAFTVARSERDCIEQIAASLSLGPAVPEVVIDAWEQSRRRHFLAEAPTSTRRRGPRYGILDQTTQHLNLAALKTKPAESVRSPLRPPPAREPEDATAPFDTLAARAGRAPSTSASVSDDDSDSVDVPGAEPGIGGPLSAPEPGMVPAAAGPARIVMPRVTPESVLPPVGTSGPRPRPARGGTTAVPERFSEEDPTLPFFDNVNVGTWPLDPDDDR